MIILKLQSIRMRWLLNSLGVNGWMAWELRSRSRDGGRGGGGGGLGDGLGCAEGGPFVIHQSRASKIHQYTYCCRKSLVG